MVNTQGKIEHCGSNPTALEAFPTTYWIPCNRRMAYFSLRFSRECVKYLLVGLAYRQNLREYELPISVTS